MTPPAAAGSPALSLGALVPWANTSAGVAWRLVVPGALFTHVGAYTFSAVSVDNASTPVDNSPLHVTVHAADNDAVACSVSIVEASTAAVGAVVRLAVQLRDAAGAPRRNADNVTLHIRGATDARDTSHARLLFLPLSLSIPVSFILWPLSP